MSVKYLTHSRYLIHGSSYYQLWFCYSCEGGKADVIKYHHPGTRLFSSAHCSHHPCGKDSRCQLCVLPQGPGPSLPKLRPEQTSNPDATLGLPVTAWPGLCEPGQSRLPSPLSFVLRIKDLSSRS